MNLKVFGARLKATREQKGMTQEELIAKLGKKDATAISEYENGKRRLAAFELPDYARALEVPIVSLFMDALEAETDKEAALLEWFRMLPDDRQQRVFEFTEDQAARLPSRMIGDQRDPKRSTPSKGRRTGDAKHKPPKGLYGSRNKDKPEVDF
jgi:transcriptional regulator with XRE-family HTH domain